MRFLLKQGKHYVGKRCYDSRSTERKDRIVESDIDLEEKYGSARFERLGGTKPTKTADEMASELKGDEEAGDEKEPDVEDSNDQDTEEDKDGDSNDASADEDEPKITLKRKHLGGGRFSVVKVVDGEVTDEIVNEENLTKDEAIAMEEKGYQG